jgi:hypothetical protein
MGLKYIVGLIDREYYMNYLTEESLPQRKQLSEDMNARYGTLFQR